MYIQVYLDVGMDPSIAAWAAARLAPIQVIKFIIIQLLCYLLLYVLPSARCTHGICVVLVKINYFAMYLRSFSAQSVTLSAGTLQYWCCPILSC